MTELAVQPQPETVAEQVDKIIAARGEPDSPETPAPVDPMEAVLPENFEHGFFRGKPVKELYKSYRATESAMQAAQRERNEARAEAERYRNDSIAKQVALDMAAEERRRVTQPDPMSEIESMIFTDPKAAMEKMKAQTLAEARAEMAQQLERERANAIVQTRQDQRTNDIKRSQDAAEYARQALGVDQDEWENEKGLTVAARLLNPKGTYFARGGVLDPNLWKEAYTELYGQAQTPPPAPQQLNPPGSKKSAPPASQPNNGQPMLTAEKRELLTMTAERNGLDADRYIARYLANLPKGTKNA